MNSAAGWLIQRSLLCSDGFKSIPNEFNYTEDELSSPKPRLATIGPEKRESFSRWFVGSGSPTLSFDGNPKRASVDVPYVFPIEVDDQKENGIGTLPSHQLLREKSKQPLDHPLRALFGYPVAAILGNTAANVGCHPAP
jgi:hypothetical protein